MRKLFILFTVIINTHSMAQSTLKEHVQKSLENTAKHKYVHGAVISVQHGDEVVTTATGNFSDNTQYFIASTTKLYTTAILLHLVSKGDIKLDDKIHLYLSDDIMDKLHVYKGVDYSKDITIKHLVSQTSGLPDYFLGKNEQGKSLHEELIKGNDQAWSFERCIDFAKSMQPKFKPGQKGKGHYTDTNFQLLGKIIENVTKRSIEENYKAIIFEPLDLKATYLFIDVDDNKPAKMYNKESVLDIPKAMASFKPDGGIVSTADESRLFLKAFFGGVFFPKEYLDMMQEWNSVMFPLEYGVGIMRFKLPRIFTLFKSMPELIGHSGLSGAFAFYSPEKDLFMTGTVNQLHKQDLSFKLMIKILAGI